ncbi:MAG: sporulation protein SpoIID, partial [Oscillospiraceae bacterium]|nr:sporulation protein SpoIID [Oscillospiraceae bacterium]
MKKRFFSLLCAVTLLCSILPLSYADEVEEGPLGVTTEETSPAPAVVAQIGLFYDDGAMDGVNLENSVGMGYRLGYMDEERVFQTLGYIGESMVSVVKNENVWYGTYKDYTCYFDDITSDIPVGCWYVQIPAEASSFEEAQEFINGSDGYFPAWINGEWQIRYGSYADESTAQEVADAMGGVVVGTSGYGVSVVRRGTSAVLFQFDGGADYSLALNPGLDDEIKAVTWMKNNKYYGIFQ